MRLKDCWQKRMLRPTQFDSLPMPLQSRFVVFTHLTVHTVVFLVLAFWQFCFSCLSDIFYNNNSLTNLVEVKSDSHPSFTENNAYYIMSKILNTMYIVRCSLAVDFSPFVFNFHGERSCEIHSVFTAAASFNNCTAASCIFRRKQHACIN